MSEEVDGWDVVLTLGLMPPSFKSITILLSLGSNCIASRFDVDEEFISMGYMSCLFG